MGKHFRDQRDGKQFFIDAGCWVLIGLVFMFVTTLCSSNNSWAGIVNLSQIGLIFSLGPAT